MKIASLKPDRMLNGVCVLISALSCAPFTVGCGSQKLHSFWVSAIMKQLHAQI